MKKEILKKMLAMSLIGAMMISTLSGCGSEEKGSTSASESAKKTESVQKSESTAKTSEAEAEDPTAEPYTIDIYFSTWGGATTDVADVQEAMSAITKEKINADVVLHPIDIGSWATQLPLVYSSGEKVDYIVTSANMAPNYSNMVSSGQLLPLTELMDKYGEGVKECLGDFMYGAMLNGDYYAVPVNKEKASSYGGFAFNKKLVEEMGLMEMVEAVESYKDLGPIFEIVHEKNPDITCYAPDKGAAWGISRDQYVDYYGTDMGGVLPIDSTDYKLVDLWTYQPYVDAITWTHEMYEKGYISEEVTTENDKSIENGTAFCWPVKYKVGMEESLALKYGYEVICVIPNAPYAQADQAQGVMGGIGSTSQNPERAAMFMNLMYTDAELLNTFIYGIEGKHYEFSSTAIDSLGNEITYIKYPEGVDSSNVGWVNQGWAYGNQFLDYLREGNNVETYANLKKTNDEMVISTTYGFAFDQSPVSTEISACKSIFEKYELLYTGALDPEKVLPKLMSELEAAGYRKIVTEKQRQLDEWRAGNNK